MAVKLEKKHYTYAILVVGVSLLLSLLVGALAIRPLYKSNVSKSKEIKDNREVLDALEDRLVTLKELKSDEARLNDEKDKVLAALPEGKDVPRLFVQFEEMVSETGSSVESARESTVSNTTENQVNIDGVTNHNYGINFKTSTYESIKNVITNAEKALRLVDTNVLNIGFKDNNFTVELGLSTYSRTDQKE